MRIERLEVEHGKQFERHTVGLPPRFTRLGGHDGEAKSLSPLGLDRANDKGARSLGRAARRGPNSQARTPALRSLGVLARRSDLVNGPGCVGGLAGALVAAAVLALAGMVTSGLQAADTAFDSLAFAPDPVQGPEVKLPEHPAFNWTRVRFAPRLTNEFPEQLKPVRTLPAPAEQVAGLAASGDELWVASRAARKVFHRDLKAGAAWDSFEAPGESAGGLCWDGQVLWSADRQGRGLFAVDRQGKVLRHFAVSFKPGAVLRVADGLLVSAGDKDEFHRLEAETGRDLGTERAPDSELSGLTKAGRYLWCSRGYEIICFDRERGLPVCGFSGALTHSGTGGVVGLTAAGDKFWYVDSVANQIVQIRRPQHGEWVGGGGRVREAGFEIVYRNSSEQAVESLPVLQHIPFLEMPGQRYLAVQVEPTPRALFRDDLGNVVALIELGKVGPGQSVRCRMATTMWVADRRMVVDPDLVGLAAQSSARAAYTRSFHRIAGEDSPEVKSFVESAVGMETNAYWRVRKAHDALCRAIYYREPTDESVGGVLRQGYGVCRNYSAAMESFGRLLGVPVLNAWAPRHETCFLMLPGLGPAVLEVTANGSGPNPATSWRRSRWFLGTSAEEITTGVRGYGMHNPLLLEGVAYRYGWHYWLPTSVQGVRHDGWWTMTNPETRQSRRL